jgi:hypothetical protein
MGVSSMPGITGLFTGAGATGLGVEQIGTGALESTALGAAGSAAVQNGANQTADQISSGGAQQTALTYLSAIWSYAIAGAKAAKQYADGVMSMFH